MLPLNKVRRVRSMRPPSPPLFSSHTNIFFSYSPVLCPCPSSGNPALHCTFSPAPGPLHMFPSSPTWHKVVAPLQILIDILTSRQLEKTLDPSYTWVNRDINLAEILGEGKWGGGINQGQHSGGSKARLGLQVPRVSCVIVGKLPSSP